jgi:toxin ParE1/3/4
MAYVVSLTVRAERDLAEIFAHIHAAESTAARRWFEALRRAIFTLREHPNRCPVTPESKKIRHLLYGHKPRIYRVIYLVIDDQKRVYVLHIRRGARRRFRTSDVFVDPNV